MKNIENILLSNENSRMHNSRSEIKYDRDKLGYRVGEPEEYGLITAGLLLAFAAYRILKKSRQRV